MKKLFIILLLSFLIACNSSDKDKDQNKEAKEETKKEQVEVDKNLTNVEVTLPATMFEGEEIESVITEAKEQEGIKEVTQNPDGSLTYKMSKAKHKEMMEELEVSIDKSIDEMVNSGDYSSIKDITHNTSYDEFTVEVDKEAFENSFDSFAIFGLGMSGAYYQFFNGASKDNYQVTIYTKDQETGEIIGETTLPDDLETMDDADTGTETDTDTDTDTDIDNDTTTDTQE
jgi:hypothetical protein